MFDWFIGGSEIPNGDLNRANQDDLVQGSDDAPETPAAIFAMRAFKQAIWGTPKPGETVSRPIRAKRHSSIADASSASISTATKQTLKGQKSQESTPPNSPAKRPGILVTPGTAGKGRKNVSFDAHQRRLCSNMSGTNEIETEQTSNKVQDRLPSLWLSKNPRGATSKVVASPNSNLETDAAQLGSEKGPFAKTVNKTKDNDMKRVKDHDGAEDYDNPCSVSGLYWKSTYEAYAKKSELQMRKLVKKEQIAKKFAKFKDAEALKLKDELARERKKVEALEAKLEEHVRNLEHTLNPRAENTRSDEDGRTRGARGDAGRNHGTLDPETGTPGKPHTNQETLETERHQATRRPIKSKPGTERSLPDTLRQNVSSKAYSENSLNAAIQEYISSDIWADVELSLKADSAHLGLEAINHGMELGQQRTADSARLFARPGREVLRPMTHNVVDPKSLRGENLGVGSHKGSARNQIETSKAGTDMMSKERREAAKRRLAERKRAKRKISP